MEHLTFATTYKSYTYKKSHPLAAPNGAHFQCAQIGVQSERVSAVTSHELHIKINTSMKDKPNVTVTIEINILMRLTKLQILWNLFL